MKNETDPVNELMWTDLLANNEITCHGLIILTITMLFYQLLLLLGCFIVVYNVN